MANGMRRPCFLSPGHEREFEMLVGYARGGISSCGEEHARLALEGLVPLTHDISAIIRCAKADLEAILHG
ncbi:MAG: hypothetical protein E5W09_22605 [Mesorhizobium sp.]|nr:MAG: hypothetical protein E5W09_22605 [Mesorhizobium sp.]